MHDMSPSLMVPTSCTKISGALGAAWDRNPGLSPGETTALDALATRTFYCGSPWNKDLRQALARLVDPLDTILNHVAALPDARRSVLDLLCTQMRQRGEAYWAWSSDDWMMVLCRTHAAFLTRYGKAHGRQAMVAIAYMASGFDRLESIGGFRRYELTAKVFGFDAVDHAQSTVLQELAGAGYVAKEPRGLWGALHTALLMQRSPRLENLTLETLQHVARTAPRSLRRGAVTLSRILARMGVIEEGFNLTGRPSRLVDKPKAAAGVSPEWLRWGQLWVATSRRTPSSVRLTYYALMKCSRWLAEVHPDVASPADWTHVTAQEHVAAVERMTIGDWSTPVGRGRYAIGEPLKPPTKTSYLDHLRSFFYDVEDWGWCQLRFDPSALTLESPFGVRKQLPRRSPAVDDDIWPKLVHAGLSLVEQDLLIESPHPGWEESHIEYPLAMVRALASLWLLGALRNGQIQQMRVGCVRWRWPTQDGGAPICLLVAPAHKGAPPVHKARRAPRRARDRGLGAGAAAAAAGARRDRRRPGSLPIQVSPAVPWARLHQPCAYSSAVQEGRRAARGLSWAHHQSPGSRIHRQATDGCRYAAQLLGSPEVARS